MVILTPPPRPNWPAHRPFVDLFVFSSLLVFPALLLAVWFTNRRGAVTTVKTAGFFTPTLSICNALPTKRYALLVKLDACSEFFHYFASAGWLTALLPLSCDRLDEKNRRIYSFFPLLFVFVFKWYAPLLAHHRVNIIAGLQLPVAAARPTLRQASSTAANPWRVNAHQNIGDVCSPVSLVGIGLHSRRDAKFNMSVRS